jgi:hypothetical protein
MDITFSPVELAALQGAAQGAETVEDVVHRLLKTVVDKFADAQLQVLSNKYRSLPPERQLEAVQVLYQWAASLPPVTP